MTTPVPHHQGSTRGPDLYLGAETTEQGHQERNTSSKGDQYPFSMHRHSGMQSWCRTIRGDYFREFATYDCAWNRLLRVEKKADIRGILSRYMMYGYLPCWRIQHVREALGCQIDCGVLVCEGNQQESAIAVLPDRRCH